MYVRWAAKDMQIPYPIAIDNDRAIWRGFNNEYWPALDFADAKGKLRHHVFGEGEYEQSEVVIQRLLTEAGASDIHNQLVLVPALKLGRSLSRTDTTQATTVCNKEFLREHGGHMNQRRGRECW